MGIPEENASPDDVRRVAEAVEASSLKTLLSEPQSTGSPFEELAGDLDVQVSSFDPLEVGQPDALESDYYLDVMRQNLENLAAAFEG